MIRRFPASILVVAFALAGVGCAARLPGEDLGGGFRFVVEPSEGASGGSHLHYRGADLGRVGFVSVAPGGGWAIFERNDDLFLIASADGNLKKITDGEFSVPGQVRWNEAEGYAEIGYVDNRPITRVELE